MSTNLSSLNRTKTIIKPASPNMSHPLDPELVSELKILSPRLETEIKEGFFELK